MRVNTGHRTKCQPHYPSHFFGSSPLVHVRGLSRVHDGSSVRSLSLLMVHLLAGVLSRTLSYPRFTHAFADLMVIRTSVGNTFPVYFRSWELNAHSRPTSSIKLLGWTQGISPYSYLPSIPMCGFCHPSFGGTGRTIRFCVTGLTVQN